MAQSTLNFSKQIKNLSKKYKETDDAFFEELEEVLIGSDIGMDLVIQLSRSLQSRSKWTLDSEKLKQYLIEDIHNIYQNRWFEKNGLNYKPDRLNIFMFVGVNGTGKTTSLAKMANYFVEKEQSKVMIIAGDTFRSGAVEQLEEWIEKRLNNKVTLVKGKPKQDPSAVIFDGLQKAQNDNYDLVLIDTAGRLQNKVNLMNELEKMHSVVKKFAKKAPHEVLLTIDATTGQNGLIQAKEFSDITNISGIILTKMDGTSKGGIALAIRDKLGIPIKLIGIGETVDDLIDFDLEEYILKLIGNFADEDKDE